MKSLGFHEVVINCSDPRELAGFWSAVTGCTIVRTTERWVGKPHDPHVVLADPEGNEFCVVRRTV